MRLIYTTLLFVHLIGVVVWVGGMFVMHFAVRPAAAAQLPPPQRLPLLATALGRFFFWVSIAIVRDPRQWYRTDPWRRRFRQRASFSARDVRHRAHDDGDLSAHPSCAVSRLQRAIVATDWPTAARNLDTIRKLVLTNLVLVS